MPSASLDFRAICGRFVFTYIGFMYRRAKFTLTTTVRVLTASSRLKGVMVGLILTVFFTGDLLLRCGDVERNPGPVRQHETDKTEQWERERHHPDCSHQKRRDRD